METRFENIIFEQISCHLIMINFRINQIIYMHCFSKCLELTINNMINNHKSFLGFEFKKIIDYFHLRRNFKPFTIDGNSGAKSLEKIENMGIISYLSEITNSIDWTLDVIEHPDEIILSISSINKMKKEPIFDLSQSEIICDFGGILYFNDSNTEIHFMENNKSANDHMRIKDQVVYSVIEDQNRLDYNTTNQTIKLSGSIVGTDMLEKIYNEFGIIIPFHLFVKEKNEMTDGIDYLTAETYLLDQNDGTQHKVSNLGSNGEFIMYDYVTKEYILTPLMMKIRGVINFFNKKFSLELPYDETFCQEKFITLKREVEQHKKNLMKQELKNLFSHWSGVTIKQKLDGLSINQYETKLVTTGTSLKSVINISSLINYNGTISSEKDSDKLISLIKSTALKYTKYEQFYQNLNSVLPITIAKDDLCVMYNSGPTETRATLISTGTGKITMKDFLTGIKTFELELNEKKDYKILVENMNYNTKEGHLIVWKMIRFSDSTKGLAKIIIPSKAIIIHNNEGLKFRSNWIITQSIYKPKFFKCYECSRCASFDFESVLYCSNCATKIVHKLKASKDSRRVNQIDFSRYETKETGYSLFHGDMAYIPGQELKENEFVRKVSHCDQKGFYYFFTVDQAINYFSLFKEIYFQSQTFDEVVPRISEMKFGDFLEDEINLDTDPLMKTKKNKCIIQ